MLKFQISEYRDTSNSTSTCKKPDKYLVSFHEGLSYDWTHSQRETETLKDRGA